ncbi:MAG TPA: hypothetical protein VLK60_15085 [Variovorax sp.]|jgi:hypothetical protein|nr:hypothetical protein [Variovorax sp.]
MNAHFSPSFTLRPQRDALRARQALLSKTRAPGHAGAGLEAGRADTLDCVAKRLPAIGDMPASPLKQRW